MGIPLQKVLSKLPKETQQKIKSKAENYIREYESLAQLRKDLGITEEEVAHSQGVRRINISKLVKKK